MNHANSSRFFYFYVESTLLFRVTHDHNLAPVSRKQLPRLLVETM